MPQPMPMSPPVNRGARRHSSIRSKTRPPWRVGRRAARRIAEMLDFGKLSAEAADGSERGRDERAAEPLAGGASRALYGFDAHLDGAAPAPLVLLVTKGTAPQEARRCARRTAPGSPVAEPLWLSEDGTSIVMRRLRGRGDRPADPPPGPLCRRPRVAPRRTGRRPRGDPCVPPTELPASERRDGAIGEIEAIEAELHSYEDPHPALELGHAGCASACRALAVRGSSTEISGWATCWSTRTVSSPCSTGS